MELDKRIKEGKRPLTCLDIEQARKFEGKQCLFSDSYVNYKNIREYAKYPQYTGVLHIGEEKQILCSKEEYIFRNLTDGYLYSLCLPLDWIEEPEKKYRPYTLAEWVDQHEIGEVIHFMNKDYKQEFNVMYTGYVIDKGEDIQDTRTTGRIMLMGTAYFLEDLFENYVICIDGEWKPFGVIEDD